MLPPIAFAASGLAAPHLAKRVGLESSLALASVAMVVGSALRAFAGSYALLLAGTAIALAGMGVGNILLPPVVKKYFPDRIGQLTAAYATLMSIGAALPAFVAAPIADSSGWRFALGIWAVVGLLALIPWALMVVAHRRERAAITASSPERAGDVDEARAERAPIWRSRIVWGITIAFATVSVNAYSVFAWLPTMLAELAGSTPTEAGALLALYALLGLPAALVVPVIAARMRGGVSLLIFVGVALFAIGYLGLLTAPASVTWLWVACAGAGPLIFPVCLVLINLRSRTHHTSIAVSGFVQTVGYGTAAFGPLIVGVLRELTGSWTAPLILLLVTSSAAAVGGILLARPGFVDDELDD
jgi:CP family cyanate transporter-like MFS transporter